MNEILAVAQEAPGFVFAEMVDMDDAGGFAFGSLDGERMLPLEETNAFVRGRADAQGLVSEAQIVVTPADGFGLEYCMQADRLSRVFLLSMFSALSEGDIELLMDAYIYDMRPYYYREGDSEAATGQRMCEIEVQGQVVRVESASEEGGAMRMDVLFVEDADEMLRERARENGWRIRRLAQVVNECDMIRTCGEYLSEFDRDDAEGSAEEILALAELLQQSTQAVLQMEDEHVHVQGAFLEEVKEKCGRIEECIGQMRKAQQSADAGGAWAGLKEICALCGEIGLLPGTLY